MMLCDRGYPELLEELRGKKVFVWACDTCARLCDVGGRGNAEALAGRLRADGIDIVGTASTGASCIDSNVRKCQMGDPDFDAVVSLTCEVGAVVVHAVAGRDVVNPVVTVGTGYRDRDGRCIIFRRDGRGDVALDDEAARLGLDTGPLVRPPSI